jgi:acid stress chaperone HdeB
MNKNVLLLTSILLLSPGQTAQAQVTVDVSKITCDQFVLYKITDPKNIAIWLSGYVHGRNNSTVVEPQTFESNMDQLKEYCMSNPKSAVMDGVLEIEKAHK